MTELTTEPGSATTSRGLHSVALAWQPGLRQTPWLAIMLLFVILACMGASACVIIISNEQTTASWKVQPTVLLAVLSSILNFTLGTALSIGVDITWWRSALRGTSLECLHFIWDRGGSGSSYYSYSEVCQQSPMQRATHSTARYTITDETIKLNIAQRLPDGWTATIGNGSSITVVGSRHGLSTVQAWWRNDTITSRNAPGYYCNGTCEGKVQGAGISYNFSSTTETLDLSTAKNDGAVIFAINSTMSESSTGVPFLLLTTLHSSAVNDSCIATLRVDTCSIEAGIVEYPITIRNSTITLNRDELQDMTVVSTYIADGDLPTARKNAGAGPLIGLNNFFGYYLYANVTELLDPDLNKSTYSGPSFIADLFFDPEPSSYDNHTFATCGLKWSSPTEYVLSSMHDFMFRAALRVGNGNDSEVQTFTARRTNSTPIFHSDRRYLAAALVAMLLALLTVLFLLWGWWDLGRPVSLSPLETAKAFGVPMMQCAGQDSTVEGILKDNRKTRVRYNVVVDDGSGIIQETEKGDKGEVGERDNGTQRQTCEDGKNKQRVSCIAIE